MVLQEQSNLSVPTRSPSSKHSRETERLSVTVTAQNCHDSGVIVTGAWTVESELRHSFTPHHTLDVRTNHVTGTDYDLKQKKKKKDLSPHPCWRVERQVKCYFVKRVIRPLIHSGAPNPEWHLQRWWVVMRWSQWLKNHACSYLSCDPHTSFWFCDCGCVLVWHNWTWPYLAYMKIKLQFH